MATVSDITRNADAYRRAYPDFGRNQPMTPTTGNCACGHPADTHDGGIGICDDCYCDAYRPAKAA